MTRVTLMTVVLAVSPLVAAAQVVPAPAAPAPRPAADPIAVPAAPLPAAPPMTVPPTPPLPPVAAPTPSAGPKPVPLPASGDQWSMGVPFDFAIDLPHVDVNIDLSDVVATLADVRSSIGDFTWIAPMVADVTAETAQLAARAAVEAAQDATKAADMAVQAELARARAWEAQLRSGDAYNGGLNALQQRQYDRAIEAFDRVIQAKGPRTDAALYWKAFGEFRLARTEAALRTIAQLQKEHAQSRYISDAKVLEAEARKQSGQALDPAHLDDDEIKLLAIQGLQRTEQAVPLLEGVLGAANSLNVKKRALYVLALSTDTRARDILMRYAKGGGNPDLQIEAVRLLVSRRDPQTTGAVLRDLYESTPDATVRRTIIDAYRTHPRPGPTSGTSSPLAATAAQDLAALFQRETDADLRRHIASVMVFNGAIDQVVAGVRNERDAATRNRLIQTLNVRNNPRATQALTDLYGSTTDTSTREAIINTLAGQQNAEALIAMARSESNVQLKTRIVRHLSEMAPRSKVAADYLMEVIR